MITILVGIAYGILCFLLGYALASIHLLDVIKLHEKANEIHEQIHVVDNKLISQKNCCPHGFEDWSDCPDCGH